uniref:N-acetyltransferase domain-containing protein n=1 Tax=Kalanchoe fedtschenkoi TaxID=63787 RepID=A0A7N0V620_KALFE
MAEFHNKNVSDVSLKPFDVLDIDDHMEWATDEKTAKFCSWEPFHTKAEFLKYYNNCVLTHPWIRAVCLRNKPVGYILVTPNLTGMDQCRAEIGYGLGSKYWGKGIATSAVKIVVAESFKEQPHLRRIEAFVDVENVASQKVLEKAGFSKEGVLREYLILKGRVRNMVLFSILSTDGVSPNAS